MSKELIFSKKIKYKFCKFLLKEYRDLTLKSLNSILEKEGFNKIGNTKYTSLRKQLGITYNNPNKSIYFNLIQSVKTFKEFYKNHNFNDNTNEETIIFVELYPFISSCLKTYIKENYQSELDYNGMEWMANDIVNNLLKNYLEIEE